jgi:hypothetical protein
LCSLVAEACELRLAEQAAAEQQARALKHTVPKPFVRTAVSVFAPTAEALRGHRGNPTVGTM